METVKILNTSIHNISQADLLDKLNCSGGVVFTPNVDHLMQLRKDEELRQVYQQADYRVCDSRIVQFASYFLGTPIREKISGSDFFPAFYQYNKDNEAIAIFLLGAREGIAQQARDKINQKVGREIVVGCYSPPFAFEENEKECKKIIEIIKQSGANVLVTGLGTPKQEKWFFKYKELLENIEIFLAIGATIDFEAGYQPRSPKWMSQVGLEWLYRLLREPQRLWRRYLIEGLPFFWLIFLQKLQSIFSWLKLSAKARKTDARES